MSPGTEDSRKLEFAFIPNLPVSSRIVWIAILVTTGLIIQWTLSVFFGWLFILAASLLGILRGRNTNPEVSTVGNWQNTTLEELEDVVKLSQKVADWREKTDTFRVTSSTGCGFTLGTLVVVGFGALLIAGAIDRTTYPDDLFSFRPPFRGGTVTPIWIIDALTMMIPIWFSGYLTAWEPPELVKKAEYLLRIRSDYKSHPDLEFAPSLFVTPFEDRSIPRDCRMLVRFKDGPKEFIGIQVQISMNDVQGKKFPYCYSVILAKQEYRLHAKAKSFFEKPDDGGYFGGLFKDSNERKEMKFKRYRGCLVETSSEGDVDVIVVRQKTSGLGYHTTTEQASRVFACALDLARCVLKI